MSKHLWQNLNILKYIHLIFVTFFFSCFFGQVSLSGNQVNQLGENKQTSKKKVESRQMATHSIILAWENSWTEEPGGLQSMWPQESDTT